MKYLIILTVMLSMNLAPRKPPTHWTRQRVEFAVRRGAGMRSHEGAILRRMNRRLK